VQSYCSSCCCLIVLLLKFCVLPFKSVLIIYSAAHERKSCARALSNVPAGGTFWGLVRDLHQYEHGLDNGIREHTSENASGNFVSKKAASSDSTSKNRGGNGSYDSSSCAAGNSAAWGGAAAGTRQF